MTKTKLNLQNIYPYLLLIVGLIGLVAALILTHDTYAISQNSHYVPSCNLNPIISCGNVINAPGDKIFGIPYPFYGIGIFPILMTAGIGMLAGARYKKWYWKTFQVVITLGTLSAYALLLKSIYSIHALCPFCLSVDVITSTLFWYTTLYNIDQGYIKLSARFSKLYKFIRRHHLDLLILWFLIVAALILKHFWYYYGKHL